MKKGKPLSREHAITMVLAVLSEGPRHGYEIGREVEKITDKRIHFNHGTLYPVLHALEEEGCIASEWVAAAGDRQRCIYHLTEHGRTEFQKYLSAWKSFSGAVNEVLSRVENPFTALGGVFYGHG